MILRAVCVTGALLMAAAIGYSMSRVRGPVVILATLTYGALFVVGAVSFSGLRRWSAAHPGPDASIIVPLGFFALLLIPALPWWGAALIALAVGAVFVPLAVRRRRTRHA